MKNRAKGWFCMAGVVAFMQVASADSLHIVRNSTNIFISVAGKPLCDYRYTEAPFKPYVAQLYTPAGIAVLRDSPFDHKHHHGLMFAIEADGVNFWEEVAKSGFEIVRATEPRADGLSQQIDWQSSTSNLVLREARMLQLHTVANVTLLTWRTKLEPPPGKDTVVLTGHHYFGLGMRFVQSMDKVATFITAAGQLGEVVRGTEHLVPAAWVACTAPVGDKVVTVAIYDHPANLRYPAPKFTMIEPFTYISTTLNLWKEPFTLRFDQPLDLCYGVAVWDGKIAAAQIEQTYRQWLDLQPRAGKEE